MELRLHHLLFDTVTTSFRSERNKGGQSRDGCGITSVAQRLRCSSASCKQTGNGGKVTFFSCFGAFLAAKTYVATFTTFQKTS